MRYSFVVVISSSSTNALALRFLHHTTMAIRRTASTTPAATETRVTHFSILPALSVEYAMQCPAGVEKLPKVHVIASEAVGVYPMLHAGEQIEPEGVDGRQLLNVSLALSAGGKQGFGWHTPAVLNVP